MQNQQPTAFPDVNALLQELFEQVQIILGSHLIGMYLDGSLTNDAFDDDSDIDFVVVTDDEIASDMFVALQAMHDRIAGGSSRWAVQLEGSYMSQRALRRYDPAHTLYPNIERGRGERLKMAQHGAGWVTHRCILRERGITIAGPDLHTLIDPVSPDDLRQAMRETAPSWVAPMLDNPAPLHRRGYQSYIVLTLCRILYTLHTGMVGSKPMAAHWAQAALGQRWAPLIERAWEGRHSPDLAATPEDVSETQGLIRETLQQCRKLQAPRDSV